jgi:spore germination protein
MISSYIKHLWKRRRTKTVSSETHSDLSMGLFTDLYQNIENIQRLLGHPGDLIARVFTIGSTGHSCAVICIDGMVDKDIINQLILKSLQVETQEISFQLPEFSQDIISKVENEILPVEEVSRANTLDQVLLSVLSGEAAIFVDGSPQALIVDSRGWASRGVEEPQTEALIRGPRDGFTENIRTNTAQIRRKIRDPNLRFDEMQIGRRAKRDVVIAYIAGIAHPELVAEAKRRLNTIDIDDAEGSGFIEQWISDSFLSPFPQIASTERPDKVSAALLQGKIAIVVDGTPFTLVLPITIASVFQSPEDYYSPWLIGTLTRMLRGLCCLIAIFLPALYIALVEYHHGMIPTLLVFSIAGAREGVPFPAVIEALMMEVTLEILREAGIRLPKPIGQTIGIVGGLVIGEAAVAAGIVSPVMVIVVSVTAVASFALPSYAFAITFRIMRFGIMLAAAFFGLYGIILAYIMINIHIVNLKSFGLPYSTPFAPAFPSDWKDLILRAPVTMLEKRPQMMQTEDVDRMNK